MLENFRANVLKAMNENASKIIQNAMRKKII